MTNESARRQKKADSLEGQVQGRPSARELMAEILRSAKEVFETVDAKEAMEMLNSGNWIIPHAYSSGGQVHWVLIRIS